MNTANPSLQQILAHPSVAEHLDADAGLRIGEHLNHVAKATVSDGITRFFAGFGAWVSAICFLIFLGMAGLLLAQNGAIFIGFVCCVAAIVLGRTTKAVFPEQLGLALAMCGNLAIVIGTVMSGNHSLESAIATHTVVGAFLYAAYPHVVYRFLAPTVLSVLITIWVVMEPERHALFHVLIGLQTIVLAILHFLPRELRTLRPLAYASAIMLPATVLFLNFWELNTWREGFDHSLIPSSLILTTALGMLCWRVASENCGLEPGRIFIMILALVTLGFITTPGVLVALGLLILGQMKQDRALMTLAHLFLGVFLWFYYYRMDVDLAYKAYVVAGSGALLLALRPLFTSPKEITA